MSVFWTFFAVLLVNLMVQKSCATVIYVKVGDSVVLHPGQSFDVITSIGWGNEVTPVLEWFGQDITFYKSFKGRSDMEKTTGSLIIHNLTLEDTGRYTPEINNMVLNPVILNVIEPVPKPMVLLKCNDQKTLCDLTCKANISPKFGPVTYKWEAENKVVSSDSHLSLTEKNLSRAYTCKVKNPVSTSSSDEVATPITRGVHPAAVVVPVVLLVLGLVVAGGYFKHRKEQKQAQTVEEAHDDRSMSLKTMKESDCSLLQ
ncbi:CD48 antigen-like isoform X2 [Poeciliopsis prolifica]|uniref:CD48 antigen-like isoform X2 n=1 Tax=Poeciliopsis prolifica TaxID=188132 RepID=UPI002413DEBE|nr:CD48 antigen-like isoform X2 [Poeciliopsis prolifica]